LLSILFGLSSALTWGAADFCGGLASRKAKAYQAVLFGEAVGLAVLLVAAFLSGEAPINLHSWLMCTIGGVITTLGLLLLFQSMIKGQMSVAAPVSALMAAFLPVVAGTFTEGFPGVLTFIGFVLALAAIWFISQPEGGPKSLRLRFSDLSLPLLAGVCFGIYYILIHNGSRDGLFWPLVSSRLGGTLTMILYALFTRQPLLPPRNVWPLIALNGALDVTGNSFYVLAGHFGRMDVAAVLASLYPGGTVILAWLFLHERINRTQTTGILVALAAIVLMTT
jgi:drug/metabolite transporter (DMT)-like permease